ncbi:MAG: hypothetical protein KBT32_06420 [Bacteroidales bacterium]|nr:hypothetical protein [Candidatus Physcocola equi]
MIFEDNRLKPLEQIADEGVQTELWLAVLKLEMFVGEVDFSLQIDDLLPEGVLANCAINNNTLTLSGEYFAQSSLQTLKTMVEQTQKNKFHPVSHLSIGSVLIHELCHAVWNTICKKGIDLRTEVKAIAKDWDTYMNENQNDTLKTYAATSPEEFWAEMLTQAVDGDSEQCPDMEFAKRVLNLAVKYHM